MAITKLMHIRDTGKASGKHLKNAILYILNKEKTRNGLLAGGNAGTEPEEIYETFLETKKEYGKLRGRQGYHFVLSWRPGTATEEQVYQMTEEFCREYLKDDYDYVFAVHVDQEHLHGHILFNSVSRSTGYKYHYANGDWEKEIQPVTDRICERHGLEKLTYRTLKSGVSYGEYQARKEGRITDADILREDIDQVVKNAMDFYSFQALLRQKGYRIREGYSQKYGEYLSLQLPGMKHARRNYRLGNGYSLREIRQRILQKGEKRRRIPREPFVRGFPENFFIPETGSGHYVSTFQFRAVRRMYRAKRIHSPYAVRTPLARKEIRLVRQLTEECTCLIRYGITDMKALLRKEQQLSKRIAEERRAEKARRQNAVRIGERDEGETQKETKEKSLLEQQLRRQLRVLKRIERRMQSEHGRMTLTGKPLEMRDRNPAQRSEIPRKGG